jgi:two-component system, OmpR family, KDP operon response regulator KdpE
MYARKPRILVVSASQLYRRVRATLREEGFEVLKASSYSRGIAMAHGYRPDLMLLDMDISSSGTMSGLDCCTLIRQSLSMPIIAVSVAADMQKKVRTLDAGADDYLVEPWGIEELVARVRACLRRVLPERKLFQIDESILYSYDRRLYLDVARQQAYVDSEPVYLTPKEFQLLFLLLLHAGKVLTYRFLLQQVWGEGYDNETGYVRVCICQLRRKLAGDYILTKANVGYLFRDGQEASRRHPVIKRAGEQLHLPAS